MLKKIIHKLMRFKIFRNVPTQEVVNTNKMTGDEPIKKGNHILRSIVCATTATNRIKENENQDFYEVAENNALNLKAVIVADGLGSYAYAELASQYVAKNLKEQIEQLSVMEEIDFEKMFKQAKSELIKCSQHIENKKKIVLNKDNSFGTSLIVAIEDANRIKVAYVGNGAIWHLRGNFNHFNKSKYL